MTSRMKRIKREKRRNGREGEKEGREEEDKERKRRMLEEILLLKFVPHGYVGREGWGNGSQKAARPERRAFGSRRRAANAPRGKKKKKTAKEHACPGYPSSRSSAALPCQPSSPSARQRTPQPPQAKVLAPGSNRARRDLGPHSRGLGTGCFFFLMMNATIREKDNYS